MKSGSGGAEGGGGRQGRHRTSYCNQAQLERQVRLVRCDSLDVQPHLCSMGLRLRGWSMFSVPDFLDRAKRAAGVDSDYALAVKVLRHKNQSRVSNWRRGENSPDDEAIIALCALTGDDPAHVAACCHSMRAANDDVAAMWRQVADRLHKGAASIAILSTLALILLAGRLDPVQAATLELSATSGGLYIMSSAIVRLFYRLWRAVHRRATDAAFPAHP